MTLYPVPALKQTSVLFILNLFFALVPLPASAESFSCPQYVAASSINIVDIPASWTFYNQQKNINVVSAGFSDGRPSEMAYLKPYRTNEKGIITVVKWKFEGAYPEGKWLSCTYEGGFFSLARELPNNIYECDVTYEKIKPGQTKLSAITCK
jgi:hypothetical protein